MSDRKVMSKLSSLVHEGAGYNEVFLSRREPKEDSPRSSERESSTQSLNDENEEEDEGDVEEDKYDEGERDRVEGEDEEEGEDYEGAPSKGRGPGSQEDGGTRPFILPALWTVNDFYLMMPTNIFKNLRNRYEILENVPIHQPRKFKQCYFRKTADVGMYDAMFASGLRATDRTTLLVGQLSRFFCQPNSS